MTLYLFFLHLIKEFLFLSINTYKQFILSVHDSFNLISLSLKIFLQNTVSHTWFFTISQIWFTFTIPNYLVGSFMRFSSISFTNFYIFWKVAICIVCVSLRPSSASFHSAYLHLCIDKSLTLSSLSPSILRRRCWNFSACIFFQISL